MDNLYSSIFNLYGTIFNIFIISQSLLVPWPGHCCCHLHGMEPQTGCPHHHLPIASASQRHPTTGLVGLGLGLDEGDKTTKKMEKQNMDEALDVDTMLTARRLRSRT